jgi:PleD family two-component response regulator
MTVAVRELSNQHKQKTMSLKIPSSFFFTEGYILVQPFLRPRILIVDDLMDNLSLLQFVLEAEGYDVVMMPEMNGFKVTPCLR